MTLPRQARIAALRLATGFPVVAITGPRQSGKTTLAREVFASKPYVSLEDPEERRLAHDDPRAFIGRFPRGAILDEAQRAPDLFSYLQTVVDERRRMGEFVLTGSQQFGLMSRITQSLAGRVGLIELLPLSLAEQQTARRNAPSLEHAIWRGGYPALYDRPLSPPDWFAGYVATYLERDLRQLISVRDLGLFQRFLKMCAARTGQLVNLSSLAADCGISHVTAGQWITVLEASYVVHLLRPWHRNFGKRLVKAPKLYFHDCGLAAWLLGVRSAVELVHHAQRGALFETLVISEFVKHAANAGGRAELHFWRDHAGLEVDLLRPMGPLLQPVEIKSGTTFVGEWLEPLRRFAELAGAEVGRPGLIYGGASSFEHQGVQILGWRALAGPAPAP